MTRLTQKSSEEARMQIHWNKCVNNLYDIIKENNLLDEFLSIDIENTGFMFNDSPIMRKIDNLTSSDGHSGSSFACCCHIVYQTLQEEKEKEIQRLKAQFRGVVKAIIKFKKLRLNAAEKIYSPGGVGFLLAQKDFNYYVSTPPPPPPPPPSPQQLQPDLPPLPPPLDIHTI